MSDSKNVVEELPCQLTDEELLEMSGKLAGLHQQKLEVEGKKKEAVNDFGARVKKIEGEVHLLSNNVFSKKETRNVECRLDYDWSRGKKTLVRLDTGEQVSEEVISSFERQQHMEFVERENEKTGKEVEEWPEEEGVTEEDIPAKDKETPEVEQKEGQAEGPMCPDCGNHMDDHDEGCPDKGRPEVEEQEGEDVPPKGPVEEESTEETEEEPGQEETEEEETPEPHECQEFGDFSAEDPACGECGDKEKCYEATPKDETSETISEEEQVEEKASGEPEPENKGKYQCVKCEGHFDEPKDLEDDSTACPLCDDPNWF